jgi:hypothetical protein
VSKEQCRENEGASHLDVLGGQQHFPSIHTIGEDTPDQREQDDRELPQEKIQSQIKGILCEVIDEPALCELLNKRPDGRGTCSDPHQAKITMPKRSEGPAKRQRCGH